jgi:hypothetical protein
MAKISGFRLQWCCIRHDAHGKAQPSSVAMKERELIVVKCSKEESQSQSQSVSSVCSYCTV